MALFIESADSSGALKRTPLGAGRTRVTAQPATQFKIVDDRGIQLDSSVGVKRVRQSLVIEGLPDEREVELVNFFRNCTPEYSCSLSLENFRAAQASEITPATIPVGALQDGSFVMHAPSTLVQAVPVAPEAEGAGRGWIYIGVGALGIAAAAGGGGSKSGGDGPTAVSAPDTPVLTSPKVVSSGTPVISGTGTPGSIITVTLDVGSNDSLDLSYVTRVGADGRWSVSIGVDTPTVNTLREVRLPEGETKLLVRASNSSGASLGQLTETMVVDTVAPAAPVINPVAGDNAISASEAAAGVTVSGAAEASTSVNVAWLGLRRTVIADAQGVWSSTYTAAQIAAGGSDRTIAVTATDAAGNASTTTSRAVSLPVGTPGSALAINSIAADDRINRAEALASGGVAVEGTAAPNARVTLTWGSALSRVVSADANGVWSTRYSNADLPADGATTITATAVDASGASLGSSSRAVLLDRVAPIAPTISTIAGNDIVNLAEAQAGVGIVGTAEAGSSVTVTLGSLAKLTTATSAGAFSVNFSNAELPASDGSFSARVTAADAVGNVSLEASRALVFNRAATGVTIAAVTGDNVVTYPESAAGVSVTGTAPAGSSVVLSWGSSSRTVTANGSGSFSALFDAASIPASGSSQVSARVTDSVGNTVSSSVAVVVDTLPTRATGTSGADTLSIGANGLANLAAPGANVNGGGGVDTLSINGSGLTLDLLNLPSTVLTSIERINLTGSGNNSVRLSVSDVLDFGTSNSFNNGSGWSGLGGNVAQRQVVIDGNFGDTATFSGNWTFQSGLINNGGQVYLVYTSGSGSSGAMILVDTDIVRTFI